MVTSSVELLADPGLVWQFAIRVIFQSNLVEKGHSIADQDSPSLFEEEMWCRSVWSDQPDGLKTEKTKLRTGRSVALIYK